MATQLAADPGTPIPGEAIPPAALEGNNDTAPIDYELEAKRMGWRPLEEFKGDANLHVDAETFYKRGQELMPILKAQNKTLLKRLDTMEREAKKASEFFQNAENRAYERALTEIRAKQEAAVETGDVVAHRAASAELDKLEKPTSPKVAEVDPAQAAEEFADWGKANKWYATNSVMQAYADAQARIIAKAKDGGFLDKDDLDAVTEKVKAKFEDEFPDEFGAAKPRPRNPVEGVSPGRGRSGGKSYSDLPPEAKATCDKWLANGTIKTKEDYVKNFDFDGWNKAAR